jgi:D-threo-aldose 1-dehydrogenase
LAASGVFSGGTLAAPADMSQGGGGRDVPAVKFGLGGVPLGNEFEVVSDEDAYKTLEAAWNAGVRYYDVSPCTGLGLGNGVTATSSTIRTATTTSCPRRWASCSRRLRTTTPSRIFRSRRLQQRCVRLHGGRRVPFDRGQLATHGRQPA